MQGSRCSSHPCQPNPPHPRSFDVEAKTPIPCLRAEESGRGICLLPDMGKPPREVWTVASVTHPGSKIRCRPKHPGWRFSGRAQVQVPRKSLPGSTVQGTACHTQILLFKRQLSAPVKIIPTHSWLSLSLFASSTLVFALKH